MALNDKQAQQLLDAAYERGLTREQAAEVLRDANATYSQKTSKPNGSGLVKAVNTAVNNPITDFLLPRTQSLINKRLGQKDVSQMPSGQMVQQEGKNPASMAKFLGMRLKEDVIQPDVLGSAGELGQYLIPATRGGVLANAGMGALSGAVLGATEEGVDNRLGNIVGDTITGGAVAGGIKTAQIGTKGLLKWLKNMPENASDAAARQLVNQTRTEVRVDEAGKNWLAKQVEKRFKNKEITPGDNKHLFDQAETVLKKLESKVQKYITDDKRIVVSLSEMLNPPVTKGKRDTGIDAAIKRAWRSADKAKAEALEEFKNNIIEAWPKNLTKADVVALKRDLVSSLTDADFQKSSDTLSSATKAGQTKVNKLARKWLRDNDENLSSLLEDEEVYINFKKSAHKNMQRDGQPPVGKGTAGSLSPGNMAGQVVTAPLRNPSFASNIVNTVQGMNAFGDKVAAKMPQMPQMPQEANTALEALKRALGKGFQRGSVQQFTGSGTQQ